MHQQELIRRPPHTGQQGVESLARIVEAEGCKAEDKGKGNLNLQAPPAGRGRRGGVHVRILGKGCVNYFSKSNKAWLTALLPARLSLSVLQGRVCVCVCPPAGAVLRCCSNARPLCPRQGSDAVQCATGGAHKPGAAFAFNVPSCPFCNLIILVCIWLRSWRSADSRRGAARWDGGRLTRVVAPATPASAARRGAAPGRPHRGGGRRARAHAPRVPGGRLRSRKRSWPRFAATSRSEGAANRCRPDVSGLGVGSRQKGTVPRVECGGRGGCDVVLAMVHGPWWCCVPV